MKKIIVIGSGFASLSASCFLASRGYRVQVLEQHEQAGGRARVLHHQGFTFDMGPSWYWMPDVFERFFACFGKKTSDYYQLERLNPSYRVFFGEGDFYDVPANWETLAEDFEKWEPGSASRLNQFLRDAEIKYREGIGNLVFKPGKSILEFTNFRTLKGLFELNLLSDFKKHICTYFSHPKILKILEFPVLFLGATPEKTPALYSLMNYADLRLGTWYPMGGMNQVVKGMVALAEELGVEFCYKQKVTKIIVEPGGRASQVETNSGLFTADVVLTGADYAHSEQSLLGEKWRNYTTSYWDSRVLAPSSLLFYCGFEGRVQNLKHHNLFFDEDFGLHAREIYDQPAWPSKPLFYLSAPSLTDAGLAPAGKENLFILIPTAPGMLEDDAINEHYFAYVADKVKSLSGNDLSRDTLFRIPFGARNFISDYNALRGNAYGLANTLMQTAILKPSMRNKKVKNLLYTGQLTVPGPGVPPALISGEVAAHEIFRDFPL
jgi:phytoene desaturase